MKPDLHDDCQIPDIVDSIVAAYLDLRDRGQAPARADWLALHAEHAAELGSFLDDLDSLSPGHKALTKIGEETLPPSAPSRERPGVMPNPQALEATQGEQSISVSTLAAGMLQSSEFGDYELLKEVARGGMGIVFKAHHKKLERVVALKMILAGQLASDQDLQRFQTEAQAAARLDHPGIVPVYEVGEHHGLHYFTMAFVEGNSLAERLRDGPLAPQQAARLTRDLAGVIQYAHEQGIVHRDLKPGNVLIDPQGQAKLTDFGLAKRTQDSRDMTGTGQILGTPPYMSPEQAEGVSQRIGPASDIYGLGALLFALLTGRPPFQAATPLETILHVRSVEPPRPRTLNPSVPRDLETICLKCLEKSPGKRYASAAALAEDLDRYLNDHPIQARPVGMIEKTFRWYRRQPVIGTMAAALALLLVAVPMLLAGLWQEADSRAQFEAAGHRKEAAAHQQEAEARRKVEALERERTKQLFQAYLNEAAARRTSPRAGRRFVAIDRIEAARPLADELELPSEDYVSLRSEAISALSLPDLRGTTTGPGWAIRDWPDPPLCRPATRADCYLAWDKPTGLLVRRIGDNRIVQRIPDLRQERDWPELSPDNRFVAVGSNGRLVVWQVDGAVLKEIARHDQEHGFTFTSDRPEVVLLTRQRDLVLRPLDGKSKAKTLRIPEIQKEPLRRGGHQSLASAGRRVAVAGANCVHIVDVDAGKVTAVCSLPDSVDTLAWSPDGTTLAVACMEGSIVFYQPASQSRRVVEGPDGSYWWVSFDPAGRFLLSRTVWGGRVILWDVASASAVLHSSNAELAAKGPAHAGPQLSGWWQGTLDPPHRFITSFLSEGGSSGKLGRSAIHPLGRLLVNHQTDGIVLGDLATGQRVGFLPTGDGCEPRFDSSGNLYSSINYQPHRWPITREGNRYKIGRPERLDPTAKSGANLEVSPDGRYISQAEGLAGATVLDRQTGIKTRLQTQGDDFRTTAFHPNGSLIATFNWNANGFRLWETATGKLIHADDRGTVVGGKFTPDGKYLITVASGIPEILLWSVPDCKLVRTLGSNAAFAISPDSRYIAAAEGAGKVRLNRIDNGDLIARFDAPGEDYLYDIYFSPEGRYLFGVDLDRTKYHVWDLWKLRRQLRELKLDWETTPVPATAAVREPIVVEIAGQK